MHTSDSISEDEHMHKKASLEDLKNELQNCSRSSEGRESAWKLVVSGKEFVMKMVACPEIVEFLRSDVLTMVSSTEPGAVHTNLISVLCLVLSLGEANPVARDLAVLCVNYAVRHCTSCATEILCWGPSWVSAGGLHELLLCEDVESVRQVVQLAGTNVRMIMVDMGLLERIQTLFATSPTSEAAQESVITLMILAHDPRSAERVVRCGIMAVVGRHVLEFSERPKVAAICTLLYLSQRLPLQWICTIADQIPMFSQALTQVKHELFSSNVKDLEKVLSSA